MVLRVPAPSSTAARSRSIAALQVAAAARDGRAVAGIFAHRGGEPVLEVGIEAVLRLARLQIEEAENQRAGKAEQRGRERNAHAAERGGEALLERIEQGPGVAADLETVDHLADRADGLDQAPEGAEQAEKDQEAGHVAGDVAGFVQPRGDRIQQMPHGLLGDRHPPRALAAQDRGHRRQQFRPPLDRKPGVGNAEIVDPGDLRIKPDHLAERQDDADQEHRADQRVQAGIGEKGGEDLLVEHDCDQRAEHQEHQHPHQEDTWARTVCSVRCRSGKKRALPACPLRKAVLAHQYGTAAVGKKTGKGGFADRRGNPAAKPDFVMHVGRESSALAETIGRVHDQFVYRDAGRGRRSARQAVRDLVAAA